MGQRVAFVFPGQGSQTIGMGRGLAENHEAARLVFAEVDEALGENLSQLCFEGPAETLQLTENAQPAILAVSVAALRAFEAEGAGRPGFVAGHSLGEYSALVAAGSLDLSTAAKIVRARGRYMQQAVPIGVGAMAAVLGATPEAIEQACAEAEQDGEVCRPANYNSPGQTVIAGHAAAVDRAVESVKAKGAKRAIRLNVSAPFHCPLMRPAAERLAADLASVDFADLRAPLVNNADANVVRDGERAKDSLIRQVASPVRWRETIEYLTRDAGVTHFVELGPGKVLSGLIRQTWRDAVCVNVEDTASLREATAANVFG